MSAAPRWDLENILPGGAGGEAFRSQLALASAEVEALLNRARAMPSLGDDPEAWEELLQALDSAEQRVRELRVLGSCWTAQDTRDEQAREALAKVEDLHLRLSLAWIPVRDTLARCELPAFLALAQRQALEPMRPWLDELRRRAVLLLPQDQASLAAELSRDSLHAWGRLYTRLAGTVQGEMPDGRVLSAGQLQNLLAHPDRAERLAAGAAQRKAWSLVADSCAAALTHIVGTRQTLNDRRGLGELDDALFDTRMSQQTLDAMITACAEAAPLIHRALDLKARLMGLPGLAWEDLDAPLQLGDAPHPRWDFDRASRFLVEQLTPRSGRIAALAQRALSGRWVEAEDRPHKRPGAWCAPVPRLGESRVFMTYGGSFRSLVTLAHELGHAYHNQVLDGQPNSRRRVPMTLAETASIYAESALRDAALAIAETPEEQITLLDARLQAAVGFLANIPTRLDFERQLYTLRRQGELSVRTLSATMQACQERWYGGRLQSYDPLFWASKMHFYISQVSFYNFPYTFGYLFSTLVYRRFRDEGAEGEQAYAALLRATGWQAAEALALEHLGLDLTDPAAWGQALQPLREDLDRMEQLASRSFHDLSFE